MTDYIWNSPQRSGKAAEIIGNTGGENCVLPLENAQVTIKSVWFGVPDEPIRQRQYDFGTMWASSATK